MHSGAVRPSHSLCMSAVGLHELPVEGDHDGRAAGILTCWTLNRGDQDAAARPGAARPTRFN